MTHLSEDRCRLTITFHSVQTNHELLNAVHGFGDVCFLRLPIPRACLKNREGAPGIEPSRSTEKSVTKQNGIQVI
jgi:hypothetical protein